MSPTKPDGSGLTNAEQKIVRGFELAVQMREAARKLYPSPNSSDAAYDRARAKLVALIRQNRPTK